MFYFLFSLFFSHKEAQDTELCEIDVVWVCYRCLHFYSEYIRVKHIHKKQITRFCGKKQSFKMFTDRIPTMHIEVQKWEFWVFLPANPKKHENHENQQNHLKTPLLHALRTNGGVALTTT